MEKQVFVFPTSFAQQRLWFLGQYELNSSVYNIPSALRLRGSLNIEALRQSLNEIIRRHESLRTTFTMVSGEPVQVIAPSLSISLDVVDFTEHPESEREEQFHRLVNEEARQPFDLVNGPLFRSQLLRLGDDDHVLLLTMHHIVSDGWSLEVLFRELSTLYRAFLNGQPSPLEDLPIQYADFAVWQREWLKGEVLDRQLSYWKKQLEGIPAVNLFTDRPRPALQSHRGEQQSFVLPKELTDKLQALSRKEGVTLFMTLLAAFQGLLYRYTGQEDIVVGSPIANRNRAEIEGLIGFFVNTLVLRSNFSDNPPFKELLARVRQTTLEAYDHQDLPFEKLVEQLQPQRDLSRSPLFQVMFVLQNAPDPSLTFEGVSISLLSTSVQTAKFDLTLAMYEEAQGLGGVIEYNTDLFDASTIARILGHLRVLLEGIVARPNERIADLPMLTEAERRQLLIEWNETVAVYPKDRCIHELFEAQAQKTPDAVAVVFGEEELTYRELNSRANHLAHYLRKLAVTPGVVVGICLERSIEMIPAILGVLKAGGTYLPLDATYPKERLAFMLEDARAAVLLTQEGSIESLPQHSAQLVCLDRDWGMIARESSDQLENTADSQDLAYLIYTSGSTGKPKGVMISHESIVSHCVCIRSYYELTESDCVLQFASVNFDASLEQILPTLISGAKLLLRNTEVPTPAVLQQTIYDSKLSVINLPTAYWYQLATTMATASKSFDRSRLRLVIVGGEEMLPEAIKFWRQSLHKDVRLLNAYGPTEATITATAFSISSAVANELPSRTVPIGRPLGNRAMYVLDKQNRLVPIGVPGELHIGGVSLARGYLNRADLTSEKFVPNPFSSEPGGRLYKTGDLARYLPDGNIEFLGRIDHQVKIRGFRIELGEIENVLVQHPAIKEAVVLAREDVPGDRRLVGYVVARSEIVPTISELRGFVKEKLPEYMVPSAFVFLDALPLTPNGKLDRRALPAPTGARSGPAPCLLPETKIEQAIAAVWQDVLKVEQVGIHDNFFDLGGHSLLMVAAHSRLKAMLGRDIPIVDLFHYPTISALAAFLTAAPEQGGLSTSADRAEKQHSALRNQRQRMQAIGRQHAGDRPRRY